MVLPAILVLFLALFYEVVIVGEDFLFLISFVIFFSNTVSLVSGYLFSDLENRRTFIKNTFQSSLAFKDRVLTNLRNSFIYLSQEDLEVNFVTLNLTLFISLFSIFELSKFLKFSFLNVFVDCEGLNEAISINNFDSEIELYTLGSLSVE
jgi:hypothetical protein